jgi:hypothetical protein
VEVVRLGQTHLFLKHRAQQVLFQVFQHMKLPVAERARDIHPVQDLQMVVLWSLLNPLQADRVVAVPALKTAMLQHHSGRMALSELPVKVVMVETA